MSTPVYNNSCYIQWDILEQEFDEKPLDKKIREKVGEKFHLLKKEAYELSEKLKGDSVPQSVYMEKMAIKTAELAVVVQSAHQEQAKFESNQITIKERLFSNCTAQGAFNAAQGLAEVTAVAAGVRLAALAIPATIPTAGVLAIGLAASLLKQASNIAKDAEKK